MDQLFYSINSHRKIVHHPHCRILQKIPKESRLNFKDIKKAKKEGYRLCYCCSPVAGKYRKEEADISNYCKESGITVRLQDEVIHIISRHDCWRIISLGEEKKLVLFHKNRQHRYFDRKHPVIINGFHLQPCNYGSILGYLEYISSHDRYRDEHSVWNKNDQKPDEIYQPPEWAINKYGEEYLKANNGRNNRVKGTKKYKKEQKRNKRLKRYSEINRVRAVIDELAVTGY